MVRPPPVTSVAGSSRGTSPGDTAGRLRSTCRVPSPSTSATSAGRVFDRICLIHRGAAQGELDGIRAAVRLLPAAAEEARSEADHLRWPGHRGQHDRPVDRKSTRLNSSHVAISYAVFCLT